MIGQSHLNHTAKFITRWRGKAIEAGQEVRGPPLPHERVYIRPHGIGTLSGPCGLDHGVGHFWPLSITRQRHLLAYHGLQ